LTRLGGNSAAEVRDPSTRKGNEARSESEGSISFSAIYKDYFDFVWSSVRRLGVANDSIDDVVQEVFVVIHSRLHTLQQPDSLRSWIYGVTRRTVSSYHRARKSKGLDLGVAEETLASTGLSPFEQTEQNDQVQLLGKLLTQLDDAKREVFVLAEIEELSVPEIAEALEIPLNTAYSRLRTARQEFEKAVARHEAREKWGEKS
jgi:RNA polymerase sigma-70 factor (ECF subfamily)